MCLQKGLNNITGLQGLTSKLEMHDAYSPTTLLRDELFDLHTGLSDTPFARSQLLSLG